MKATSNDAANDPLPAPLVSPSRKWKPGAPVRAADADASTRSDAANADISVSSDAIDMAKSDFVVTPDPSNDDNHAEAFGESTRQIHFQFYQCPTDDVDYSGSTLETNAVDREIEETFMGEEDLSEEHKLVDQENVAPSEVELQSINENPSFDEMASAAEVCDMPDSPSSTEQGMEGTGIVGREKFIENGDANNLIIQDDVEDLIDELHLDDHRAGHVVINDDHDHPPRDSVTDGDFAPTNANDAPFVSDDNSGAMNNSHHTACRESNDIPANIDATSHFSDEPASPSAVHSLGHKSRFSKSFSKAKIRFEKRKHLGGNFNVTSDSDEFGASAHVQEKADDASAFIDGNDENEVIGDDDVNEEELIEPLWNDDNDRFQFNHDSIVEGNKFRFYVPPGVEEVCNGNSQVYEGGDHGSIMTREEIQEERFDDDSGVIGDGTKHSFYSPAEDDVCNSGCVMTEDDTGEQHFDESVSDHDGDEEFSNSPVPTKFSFYSSTCIYLNSEEKEEMNIFDEDEDKVAPTKFSFFSSTPIKNASFSDDNCSDDNPVNSSFLVDGHHDHEESPVLDKDSNEFASYETPPINTDGFDRTDAFEDDECKVESNVNNILDDDSGCDVLENSEVSDIYDVKHSDEDYANEIIRELPSPVPEKNSCGSESKTSYTMNLHEGRDRCDDKSMDCSSRSFVSFREKKNPRSLGSCGGNSTAAGFNNKVTKHVDTESPTSVVHSLHSKTLSASNTSPLMKKYQLGRSLDITASTLANHKASTTMFTRQDIDSITPRQIANYLTLNERKSIGTKVLSGKMMRGYTIAVATTGDGGGKAGSTICSTCDMPMMCKRNKNLEYCVICPVLKKKVLKKILTSVNEEVPDVTPVADAEDLAVSEARKAILDVSKRESYYKRTQPEEGRGGATSEWYVEGRNAVAYAKDVLANKVSPYETNENQGGDEEIVTVPVSPRILFPDDVSVEVVQNDTNLMLPSKQLDEIQVIAPPPPMTPVFSPKGRPPLSPHTPCPVKPFNKVSSSTSQCSTVSRRSHNSVSSLSSQPSSSQQNKAKHSSQSTATACSNPQLVASSALTAIQDQMEDTKHKLMHAKDPAKQIMYADLLTKLNGALMAVKKLDDISQS